MIKRHVKEGKSKQVFALLNNLRYQAMSQTGYIKGETLLSHYDPRRILVISTWHSFEHWFDWKENDERKANEAKLEQYLEFPTEYEEYVWGTYPHS